jgi:uncharacterized protein (TIGR02118 family)
MINVAILYPNEPGRWFDATYYIQRHMPMSIQLLSAHRGYRGVSVELGLGGGEPGTEAAYVAMCNFRFESAREFIAAFTSHADVLRGDMGAYTDIEPIIQINDVAIAA